MKTKSPVTDLNKPFGIDTDMFFENIFIRLGHAPMGRYHLILFNGTTLAPDELRIVEDTKRVYSSDCIQYLIRSIENKIIGSFFEVNFHKLTFDESRCIILDSGLEEDIKVVDDVMGGVYVFSDEEESFLLIPENPNTNKYVVLQ